MYKKGLIAALSSLTLLLLFSAIVYAQIGEIAGHLNFYVPVGGSNSLLFTLANGGSTPLHFIVEPYYVGTLANRTSPIITISPLNGIIQPYSQFALNVTASVPAKNNSKGFLFWQTIPKGESWSGDVEVVAVGGSSISGGGANIEAGVVKVFTVTPYVVPPGPLVYAGIAALVVIVVGIIFYFAVYKKRYAGYRPSKKAVAGRAKAVRISKALRGRKVARARASRRKRRTQRKRAKPRKAARRRRR